MPLNLASDQMRSNGRARRLEQRTAGWRGTLPNALDGGNAGGGGGAPSWDRRNRAIRERREMLADARPRPQAPFVATAPRGLAIEGSIAANNAEQRLQRNQLGAFLALSGNERADAGLALARARFQDDQLYRAAQLAMGRDQAEFNREMQRAGLNLDVFNMGRDQANADRAFMYNIHNDGWRQDPQTGQWMNPGRAGEDRKRRLEDEDRMIEAKDRERAQQQQAWENWMKWMEFQREGQMDGLNVTPNGYNMIRDTHKQLQDELKDAEGAGWFNMRDENQIPQAQAALAAFERRFGPALGIAGQPQQATGLNVPGMQGGGRTTSANAPLQITITPEMRSKAAAAFAQKNGRFPAPDELNQLLQAVMAQMQ